MPDWFSETMLKIVTSVPALFVAEDSPTFMAVRAMILIVLVVYVIAMRPFRSAIARYMGRAGEADVEARSEGQGRAGESYDQVHTRRTGIDTCPGKSSPGPGTGHARGFKDHV